MHAILARIRAHHNGVDGGRHDVNDDARHNDDDHDRAADHDDDLTAIFRQHRVDARQSMHVRVHLGRQRPDDVLVQLRRQPGAASRRAGRRRHRRRRADGGRSGFGGSFGAFSL